MTTRPATSPELLLGPVSRGFHVCANSRLVDTVEMDPRTVFEKADKTASGSRVGVRAALFSVGGQGRGGVTLTVHVPAEFAQSFADGSMSATVMLNPDEGLAIGEWLREAFRAVDHLGPPMFTDKPPH